MLGWFFVGQVSSLPGEVCRLETCPTKKGRLAALSAILLDWYTEEECSARR